MLYRIEKDLVNWICAPKLWTGLTIGLVGFLIQFVNLLKLVYDFGTGVNIFETYALGCTNSWTMTISVAGLIFSLSDMPYLSSFEMNAIYRSNKRHYILEKFTYSVICTAIFYIFQFVLTIIISFAISYTENVWSLFSFAISDEVKGNISPAIAALFSLFLNFMYGLMLIGILFLLSLLFDKGIAVAVIFTFQAIQHFLMMRSPSFSLFCVFRNSILNYHGGFNKEIIVHLFLEIAIIFITIITAISIKNRISYDVRQEDNIIL